MVAELTVLRVQACNVLDGLLNAGVDQRGVAVGSRCHESVALAQAHHFLAVPNVDLRPGVRCQPTAASASRLICLTELDQQALAGGWRQGSS